MKLKFESFYIQVDEKLLTFFNLIQAIGKNQSKKKRAAAAAKIIDTQLVREYKKL